MKRYSLHTILCILVPLLVCTFIFAQNFLLFKSGPISDERYHIGQIESFVFGNFGVNGSITTPPFFHGLYALLSTIFFFPLEATLKATGLIHFVQPEEYLERYFVYRVIASIFTLLALYALGRLAGLMNLGLTSLTSAGSRVEQRSGVLHGMHKYSENKENESTKSVFWISLLYFFLIPCITPFGALVYTDFTALFFILLATERALREKNIQSALCIISATLIRQPAIIWGLLPFYISIRDTLFTGIFTHISTRTSNRFRSHTFRNAISYILVFGLFALFIYINNGIALGDRSHHTLSLNFTNVWVLIALWGLFFLPDCIRGVKRFWHKIDEYDTKKEYLFSLVGPLLVSGSIILVYNTFMSHVHDYNNSSRLYFLRNRILQDILQDDTYKLFFSTWVVFSAIGLLYAGRNALLNKIDWLVFVCIGVLSVITLPVVEQRYYTPFFALYICLRLWRKEGGTPGSTADRATDGTKSLDLDTNPVAINHLLYWLLVLLLGSVYLVYKVIYEKSIFI